MIRNTYGNSASPLQGEVVAIVSDPTLRIGLMSGAPAERIMRSMTRAAVFIVVGIGLMSGAPAERIMRSMTRAAVLIVVAMLYCSCSTRVVYERKQAAPTLSDAININTAAADDLEELPHIGRKTAEAIVDHRERHGAFRRVEHLMLIRGMSESRFIEVRDLIRIE